MIEFFIFYLSIGMYIYPMLINYNDEFIKDKDTITIKGCFSKVK